MSSFSDYTEDAVLDHVFRNVALTSPTTVYLSLYTVAPTDAGGGTEVTGGGYARQAITMNAATSGSMTNSGAISFTASGANFGSVVAVGVHDALTTGNLLAWDGITSATVNDGDTITFADAGGVTITLS